MMQGFHFSPPKRNPHTGLTEVCSRTFIAALLGGVREGNNLNRRIANCLMACLYCRLERMREKLTYSHRKLTRRVLEKNKTQNVYTI